jgi:hypothetical protein
MMSTLFTIFLIILNMSQALTIAKLKAEIENNK